MTQNIPQPTLSDRRMERRERRGSSWTGGLFLIVLGILLLMQTMGSISFGRWWSVLILIPALGAFINALKEYRAADNQLTRRAVGALIAGLALCAITAALLFNLDWSWFGPALLLLAGVGFLTRSFLDQKNA